MATFNTASPSGAMAIPRLTRVPMMLPIKSITTGPVRSMYSTKFWKALLLDNSAAQSRNRCVILSSPSNTWLLFAPNAANRSMMPRNVLPKIRPIFGMFSIT
ncbi:hypothetical protein SN16_10560 [Salinicoccus roseus]|uniref:Uncharacterized protein n=1 Tax=Salinicoccus roseus TaxID=45670 RepID=A0A0C2HE77_9STAP|nr:hypothetical protein SN16_10560 [Salinicoccus roseus]